MFTKIDTKKTTSYTKRVIKPCKINGLKGLAQLLVDGKKEGLAPPVPIIERPTDQKVRGSNPLPRANPDT